MTHHHTLSPPHHHFHRAAKLLHHWLLFVQHNAVLCIAITAALVTLPFVPPDSTYLQYIDYRTIACLFATLAVVGALKNISFFSTVARKIVCTFTTLRSAGLALVVITFVGSMLIANDMALITFLPLGWFVLRDTGNTDRTAFILIMQNIAANLGGMLTPFGNPQNLYLYSHFNIPTSHFVKIMLFPFLVAIGAIMLICLIFLPSKKLTLQNVQHPPLPASRVTLYLVLFALALCMVFRLIPVLPCVLAIVICLAVMDRQALLHVDYALLLTFVSFFIFASNMSRIEVVRDFFSSLLSRDPLFYSTVCCQFISNVPTAILLSGFTDNYAALLVGVNIGGAGTLIASLASLITFREFQSRQQKRSLGYLGLFSAINFGMLIFLFLFCKLVLHM